MDVDGGTLIVRTLKKAGVDAVFALHGAHIDTIFQATVAEGIQLIDTRHEAAAGHAAEGYARARRSLGVAVVTAGPGFTNVLTSMANAFTDRTPVLYIGGAPGLGEAETNGLQNGIDQVAMATPITKWAQQINRPEDIVRLIGHAIRVATTAPMGPVYVNLPADVARGTVDAASPEADIAQARLAVAPRAFPDPESVDEILRLLADARRPALLVGSDTWWSDAGAELLQFVETTGIPVFSDFAAHGLIPAEHPRYGGTGHKMAYLGDDRPDVVLALGTRFGLFTLGAAQLLFPDATVIHVNADRAEIDRVRVAELAVVADPAATLTALNTRLTQKPVDFDAEVIAAWVDTVRAARTARAEQLDADAAGYDEPIHPRAATAAVARAATDLLLVADGAEAYHWLNEAVSQAHAGSYLTHGHLGAMGMGLGLAIGAQVAAPDRRVLLLAGDGAIGFNIAEFDTMVRHGLPVVVVVVNNHSWGASEHFQDIVPTAHHKIGTQLADARYDQVAAGFGADGVRITRFAELGPALEAAFASGRPTCIDVRVAFDPQAPELNLMMAAARPRRDPAPPSQPHPQPEPELVGRP